MEYVISPQRRRAVFAAAALSYILSQFYRSFLTVIVDDLGRDLGAGPRDLGMIGAAWFIVFALAQFPVGVMLDRIGPRRTIAGLMLFAVVGTVIFATSTSVNGAALGMALVGLGFSPCLMGTFYFLARTETPARFAALSSLFLGVGLTGGLFASTPLALAVRHFGWRLSIGSMAVLTVIALALIVAVMRDPPREEAGKDDGSFFGALFTLVSRPVFWPILVMSIFITAEVWTARTLWVGPFFGEVHGLDPVARGNVILVFAITMAISAVVAGPLASRLENPRLVVLLGTGVTGLAFLALALIPNLSFAAALGLYCVAGLFGVTYAVQIAHSRLFMPPHVIGRGIAFVNFLSIGGTALLQYLSGIGVEHMKAAGRTPAETYASIHLAFAIILFAAWVIYLFAPSRPKNPV